MDWWYEFSGCETEEDPGRKIVLSDSVAKLEVLMEHCAEG